MSKSNTLPIAMIAATVTLATIAYSCSLILMQEGEPQDLATAFSQRQVFLTWGTRLAFMALLLMVAGKKMVGLRLGLSLLASFLFFATFILLDFVWLDELLFHYRQETELWEGGFSISLLLGGGWIGMAALVCAALFAKLHKRTKQGEQS